MRFQDDCVSLHCNSDLWLPQLMEDVLDAVGLHACAEGAAEARDANDNGRVAASQSQSGAAGAAASSGAEESGDAGGPYPKGWITLY